MEEKEIGDTMVYYRFEILCRYRGKWVFDEGYMTEEAADRRALMLSLNDFYSRIKVIERYEDGDGAHPFRIFYFSKGKYSHCVRREL